MLVPSSKLQVTITNRAMRHFDPLVAFVLSSKVNVTAGLADNQVVPHPCRMALVAQYDYTCLDERRHQILHDIILQDAFVDGQCTDRYELNRTPVLDLAFCREWVLVHVLAARCRTDASRRITILGLRS